ncbi:TPA: hypothetical protein L4W78_005900 [Pseudomonas aeruginosa]|uniref:hypothetical protein n=1 Tax=Pseudomonas aeruginosa TaxID=287 RepID=UPI001F52417C|nr:hypothetical protein [Pseudomonas aeruginosa]MCI0909594.1 hypothetical protein [Pseudomonas aeruginosa]HBO5316095.1 hypothetical protein [Pseudomonas aeruginosa]HCF1738646.1 hypothetical protein [Pseudomonas aeruginosa]HCF1745260.1 hypothetical protein [Pseudomonas aeruginosa]HCF3915072.1 hypothetical protein [Pseudomonas aeruginosa]
MAKRKVHYENWNGGTESDPDRPSETFCGMDVTDPLTATRVQAVTCKYCLKLLEFFGHKVKP